MNMLTIICIAVAIFFAVLESITVQLVGIWFCISAIVSAFVAHFTDSYTTTIVVFVIVSAIMLIFTRPIIKKKIIYNPEPTNADRIIGKTALVIQRIDSSVNSGQIKVDGQVWSARSSEVIDEGETVRIKKIEGVKAIVQRIKEEVKC